MTTVVFKDGVMAADSGVWASNVAYNTAIKIEKAPDGSLHGVCGTAGAAETYLAWARGGMVGDAPKPAVTDLAEGRSQFLALVISTDGEASIWTAFGIEHHHKVRYIAIGGGSEMAVGAMAAGATAEEAIGLVAANSEYARLPVRTIRLGAS